MSEDLKNKLKALLFTLNSIEVHGKQNLDMLLGCVLTLQSLIKEDE